MHRCASANRDLLALAIAIKIPFPSPFFLPSLSKHLTNQQSCPEQDPEKLSCKYIKKHLAASSYHYSPTRMNLTLTKGRLKGAQTGHSLLAKKRDALTTRFRQILRKVDEVRQ